MGLFDFFKKKPSHIEKISLAYQCYKQELVGMVYPGGLEQANLVLRVPMILGYKRQAVARPISL